MKWPIILPLLFAIPIIVAFEEDQDDDMDMTEFERARRTAFMLPSTFYGRRHYGFYNDDDDNDEVGMTRKRRFFYAPYAPKFVSDSDEGDDIEDDLEDFERKRRAVLLYPGNSWFNKWKKRSSEMGDIKRSDEKRGSPYFFPLFHYNPSAYKRVSRKRSLLEAFTRDDPTAFGYDKRGAEKKSDIEDRRRKKST